MAGSAYARLIAARRARLLLILQSVWRACRPRARVGRGRALRSLGRVADGDDYALAGERVCPVKYFRSSVINDAQLACGYVVGDEPVTNGLYTHLGEVSRMCRLVKIVSIASYGYCSDFGCLWDGRL